MSPGAWQRPLIRSRIQPLAATIAALGLLGLVGCSSSGSKRVRQLPPGSEPPHPAQFNPPAEAAASSTELSSREAGPPASSARSEAPPGSISRGLAAPRGAGRDRGGLRESPPAGVALGRFRNTYYNFPSAADYRGRRTRLFDARCRSITTVPVAFHDTLCVQGSGQLQSGQTVSYARRNCDCARTCPRTGQKICFQALDPKRFPWGRGAMGTAIEPLRTVAVDGRVVALGSSLYVPAYAGLPTQENGRGRHDGCFTAADRGIGIVGKHIDVFTGSEAMTRLYNRLLPSNRALEVFLDSPRCRAPTPRADAAGRGRSPPRGGALGGPTLGGPPSAAVAASTLR